jgi:hypothetical protein
MYYIEVHLVKPETAPPQIVSQGLVVHCGSLHTNLIPKGGLGGFVNRMCS